MRVKSPALLDEMMKSRRVSNADLGRYASQHRSAISALRNGRRTTCTDETAELVAEFFQVPLEVLFVPRTSAASGVNIMEKAS